MLKASNILIGQNLDSKNDRDGGEAQFRRQVSHEKEGKYY